MLCHFCHPLGFLGFALVLLTVKNYTQDLRLSFPPRTLSQSQCQHFSAIIKNSRCNLLKNNYACIVRLMRHMQNRKWHPTLTDEPSMLANALDTRKSVVSRCSVKTDQTGCPIACLPLSDLCIKACPCLVSLHCRARAALDIKPETKLDAEKPAQTVPQCSLCKSLCGKLQMANNTLILRMAKPHARTCQAQLSYLAHLKCCLDTCPVSIHAEGPKTFH